MKKSSTITPLSEKEAEEMAVRLLDFMASSPEHMARFLALSGMGPDDVGRMVRTREFSLALFDHVLADEGLLLSFCTGAGIAPEMVAPARHLLSGERDGPEWM